ncbi:MAG TPA: hypothetical protein VMB83_05680 [Roseiarcus sp.]|nr:hypothetical protein [Roseiarcus sp.]
MVLHDETLPPHETSAPSAQIETLLIEKRPIPATLQGPAARLFKEHDVAARASVKIFLRRLVNEARMKHNVNGYTFTDPVTGKEIELRFFLAGGGAESGWYRAALSLDPKTDLAFHGVNKLRLETVKRSAGFRGAEFPRFVIALGLTSLPDELEAAHNVFQARSKRNRRSQSWKA